MALQTEIDWTAQAKAAFQSGGYRSCSRNVFPDPGLLQRRPQRSGIHVIAVRIVDERLKHNGGRPREPHRLGHRD